jgi:hypothetical protein
VNAGTIIYVHFDTILQDALSLFLADQFGYLDYKLLAVSLWSDFMGGMNLMRMQPDP